MTGKEDDEFLQLKPFLEPMDPDYPDGDNLVAGFKTPEGERWGVLVPVPSAVFQSYLRDYAKFEVLLDPDGTLMPSPADPLSALIDFDPMFEGDQLQKAQIDDLTRDMIDLYINEDNPKAYFLKFRAALGRAMELLDAEIARRETE